jgi:hypothetical protein
MATDTVEAMARESDTIVLCGESCTQWREQREWTKRATRQYQGTFLDMMEETRSKIHRRKWDDLCM